MKYQRKITQERIDHLLQKDRKENSLENDKNIITKIDSYKWNK